MLDLIGRGLCRTDGSDAKNEILGVCMFDRKADKISAEMAFVVWEATLIQKAWSARPL